MKWIFSFAVMALMPSFSFASDVEMIVSKKVIEQTVERYYDLAEFMENDEKNPPRYCLPDNGSCFVTACQSVDRFECDDQDEMNNLRRACRGNWGDTCLKVSISFLDRFEYDDNEEMAQVANSCRGVYDHECIRFTCDRVGRFGCDDLEEIVAVNAACSGDY